uniref:Terpene synthase n=1 Tax=Clitopilus sp. TaxID=1967123 RepID=A0A4P2VG86_9AGAR|nr:putative sesquiterpene synthase [Clitopilus sp.]
MPQDPPTTFRIPDLETIFSVFPDEGTNPHYDDVFPEAREWILRCKVELLTCYIYPSASKSRLRSMMDLYNLFWIYDETTDVQTGQEAKETAQVVRNALTNPDFSDDSWLCAILQDFRRRNLDGIMSPGFVLRFIDHFCDYANGVADEALFREKDLMLDIQEYLKFRREAAAVRVVLDSVEYCLDLELEQNVMDDPVFQMAYNAALDLAFGTNDIQSYNMEQAKQHKGANIISVIMRARTLDLQGAMDYFGGYCQALTAQFLDAKCIIEKRVDRPEWKDAVRILEGYGCFLAGQVRWGFTTERYFGKKNKEVESTKVVELRAPFVDHVHISD